MSDRETNFSSVQQADALGKPEHEKLIRLLHIEDDQLDFELLKNAIARIDTSKYELDHSDSLKSAEELLASKSDSHYDVVILDLSLPDANGLDAIRHLRAKHSLIPIIILTGNEVTEDITWALNAGAQDYLLKGHYSPELLHRTISYSVDPMQHQREISTLAHLDQLTQLPNRLSFNLHIEYLLNRARRYTTDIYLLMLDFDAFKQVNDVYGHQSGDEFLSTMAQRLNRLLRSPDFVARLGGDEFAIVIEQDSENEKGLMAMLDRLKQALSEPIYLEEYSRHVNPRCSIGVAKFDNCPAEPMSLNTLLHQADTAMYEAKRNGGNDYQFYDEDIQKRTAMRRNIDVIINQALEDEQFVLFYQPIVALKTGECQGLEALIRWRQPDGTMASPVDFIPALEESNRIIEVGGWVLRRACEDFKRLVESGYMNTTQHMSVNVSPKQFLAEGFYDKVSEIIAANAMPAECLRLEITERLQIEDPDRMIRVLSELKELGVSVAIDDFGTGFSSMLYLKDMPVDTIKIDRSFVANYLTNKSDHLIVNAMIRLIKSLEKNLVLEGIETVEVLESLQAAGCESCQGFYFSKPLPYESLIQHLTSGTNGSRKAS